MCFKLFNPFHILFVYVNATMYVIASRKLVINNTYHKPNFNTSYWPSDEM